MKNLRTLDAKEKLKVFGPTIVVLALGFLIAYQFVAPAPPRSITIATGSPEGAYFAYAQIYKELLAKNGIELVIKTTAGSAENIALLETAGNGADIAFVQGGLRDLSTSGELLSLGSLFFEPLWIFHRDGIKIKRLPDIKGLRVAVGEAGSGTRILAMKLLALNGISDGNTRLLSIGDQQAADMLLGGKVDVAMLVVTHRASYAWKLLESKMATLVGLERADAYVLAHHYLYKLTLPEGVLDFKDNIPAHDLVLVAPTTQLVVKTSMHPALIDLLLQAAEKVHHQGGGFEREGAFPSPKYLDFDLSEDAERFYKSGPPFLQRYLPFWVATFLARMKVMLLPLVALLFPLFKIMPIAYRWKMRSKIYRWYSKLETVDPKIHEDMHPDDLKEKLDKLDRIEAQVSAISVPLAYSEELYALRMHIGMLRDDLLSLRQSEPRES